MKIVVQKVKKCVLYSEGEKFSEIKNGLLVLVGVSVDDKIEVAEKIAQKILKLRIFDDENGKNIIIPEIKGDVEISNVSRLLVSLLLVALVSFALSVFLEFLLFLKPLLKVLRGFLETFSFDFVSSVKFYPSFLFMRFFHISYLDFSP